MPSDESSLFDILKDNLRSGDEVNDIVGVLLDAAYEVIPRVPSRTGRRMQMEVDILSEALDMMLQIDELEL